MFTVTMCIITAAVMVTFGWFALGGMFSKDLSRNLAVALLVASGVLVFLGVSGGLVLAFVAAGVFTLFAVFAGVVSLGGE